MRRNILALLVSSLLIFACSPAVFAEDFDPLKKGDISVTLMEQYDNEAIVGAELSVYHVATVNLNANGKLVYDYTDSFKNLEIDIDDPSLSTNLDAYVLAHSIPNIKMITDENGTAICNDLALGLYFIRQSGTVEGFAPCTPFVVSVPSLNDDSYLYNVNASPKTEVARLISITIKKVWNTDVSTPASDSVTVQLLKNDNVINTVTLNDQNNWQVTFTEMPASDAYSIKEINIPDGFTATYTQSGYNFTVTNTSTLIQTGQLIWPIPLLAVVGMLLIVVGFALLKKKRKTNA